MPRRIANRKRVRKQEITPITEDDITWSEGTGPVEKPATVDSLVMAFVYAYVAITIICLIIIIVQYRKRKMNSKDKTLIMSTFFVFPPIAVFYMFSLPQIRK